jgi:enterochelin esterase-like enzyme
MLEIGKTKIVAVRRAGKTLMEEDGITPQTKVMESIVQRITRNEYGHNSKYSRKLIVRLHGEDTVTIRPVGLRTEALIVTANIGAIYKDLLVRKIQKQALAKARAKKETLKHRRAILSMRAKERRFRQKLKAENNGHA